PVHLLEDIIEELDLVLIMTVNPGFGGQKFISGSYNKIKRLKQLIDQKNAHALIQVDGGVDLSNIRKLADTGVNVMVIGSYIFKSSNPIETISQLKKA
ncbi:MAG TPA: ribulose-phosphate 3-epimerase, partial [Bacteroidales bacterium]|nr:ribulose-phosphate 3-epimerase [Bacteroidales bacterium]